MRIELRNVLPIPRWLIPDALVRWLVPSVVRSNLRVMYRLARTYPASEFAARQRADSEGRHAIAAHMGARAAASAT